MSPTKERECSNAHSCQLFQHQQTWVLLMIDEATRFKIACAVKGREHKELLGQMLEHWFMIFGPPRQLVMDQESSLMSHEAGRELERFNVERVPKGTTAGPAGRQHTGIGLIERHIGLLQITMQKMESELDRQGLQMEVHGLARECGVAHNQSLNYGGYTPSMAVFGVPEFFLDRSSRNGPPLIIGLAGRGLPTVGRISGYISVTVRGSTEIGLGPFFWVV